MGVRVREALRQIDAVKCRVVLEPGRPRLPHNRRPAEEAGAPALGINGELGRDDDVEEWLQWARQWPYHTGDQDGGVTGGSVISDPAYCLR